MSAIRVLLIDDDRTSLDSLKDYLETTYDYAVSDFMESRPALKALQKHTDEYDVLLMDWTLKPLGGEELLEKIKEISPDLPVIVLTANEEAGEKAYGKGAYAYFQKPIPHERLVHVIQHAANKETSSAEKSLELLVNFISTLLVEQRTSVNAFANAIISKASSLVGSNTGYFYVWNWKEKNFQEVAIADSIDAPRQASPDESEHALKAFSESETGILINVKDEVFQSFSNSKIGYRAAVRLQRGYVNLGLLVLDKAEAEFTEQDRKTLRALKTLVDPLLEQMNARNLLQKIELGNYTSEEDLGEAVVNALFELFGKPTALWLMDRGHTEFKIQSAYGLPDSYQNNACIHYDDVNSLVVSATNTRKADQWGNTGTSVENVQPSELLGLEKQGINSILAIPLFTSENAPIGVLNLYATQKNAFKEYDIQTAQNFAAQTAKALENLRRQRQSEKLEALAELELSETPAAGGQDERGIFAAFAKAVLELTGAYNIAIYPYDFKLKHWSDASQVIIVGRRSKLSEGKKLSKNPRETDLAFIIRHAGKILVEDTPKGAVSIQPIEDLEKIPGNTKFTPASLEKIVAGEKFIRQEPIRAFAGISLRAPQMQAEVGVMYVNFQTPRRFTGSEISVLQIAARQVASTIHSHRLSMRQQMISDTLKEIINDIGTADSLSAILEQAANLFSADYASIGRLTEDGQHLHYQSIFLSGPSKGKKVTNAKHPIGDGIIGNVTQTGASFLSGHANEEKNYVKVFEGTKSEMAIPLKNAFGGVIGVLNLESVHPDFFSEEDEKLCGSFARAASAAIQQSELFESIKSLHRLTESLTLKDLLDQVLRNLNKMIGTNTSSSVSLYDKENDDFHAFYGVGPNQEFTQKYLMLSPRKEKGTGRHVLETKQPLWYDDVNNISEGFPEIRSELKEQEIVSYAALPLKYQDEILGTLFVQKKKEKITFTDDAKQMLETYADQAALAIHNAQHLIDIEPLKAILDATISRNRQEILSLIVEKAVGVVNSDYSSIWMGEESGDLVQKAIYIRPEEQECFNSGNDTIKKGRGSINMAVYQSGEPTIVNDVSEKEKQHLYNRYYQKAKSEVAVPLVFRGKVIGTLNAESQYLGAYSEFDETTLRIFADVAAIAIKLAEGIEEITKEVEKRTEELARRGEELFHMNYRLERRNASFEALTEIGQQLTANIQRSEGEILSIIHRQASRIMDTNNMYVALYDAEKDLVCFELAFLDGTPVDINNDKDWQPRPGGQGRTEWIIRHKAPILTYTKADAEAWYRQPGTQEYIGQTFASWLGVPILFGGEVMGVIATYHKTEEYKYDPDDIKILALMGRQAAIALKNARLVRLLDKRIIELDAIRELGEDLSKSA
jgi:GAF domain-containing protein/CheY-like chemotaxis protein